MQIIKLPSPNYFDPLEIPDNSICAICLHGTASNNLQSALDWLRNPQPRNPTAAVSSNYVISRAGNIYELVNPISGKRAWANGYLENYDTSVNWLNRIAPGVAQKTDNPNYHTVSIEHEATWAAMVNHGRLTDVQWTASQELSGFILKQFGLKANHETIITHSQISGKQKYNCPGVIFAPSYIEELQKKYPELKD